jgi:hypothetical protein
VGEGGGFEGRGEGKGENLGDGEGGGVGLGDREGSWLVKLLTFLSDVKRDLSPLVETEQTINFLKLKKNLSPLNKNIIKKLSFGRQVSNPQMQLEKFESGN